MLGHVAANSSCHVFSTDNGATTKHGFLLFASLQWPMYETSCLVFPMPISSAKTPPIFRSFSEINQFNPVQSSADLTLQTLGTACMFVGLRFVGMQVLFQLAAADHGVVFDVAFAFDFCASFLSVMTFHPHRF